MINNAIPKRSKKKTSSLTMQKRAIVILLAICFILAAALVVTNMLTAMSQVTIYFISTPWPASLGRLLTRYAKFLLQCTAASLMVFPAMKM